MNIQLTKRSKCSTSVAGSLLRFVASKIKDKCSKYKELVLYILSYLPSVASVARFPHPIFTFLYSTLVFYFLPLRNVLHLLHLQKNALSSMVDYFRSVADGLLRLCYTCYTWGIYV
jgi:hypothetical protein